MTKYEDAQSLYGYFKNSEFIEELLTEIQKYNIYSCDILIKHLQDMNDSIVKRNEEIDKIVDNLKEIRILQERLNRIEKINLIKDCNYADITSDGVARSDRYSNLTIDQCKSEIEKLHTQIKNNMNKVDEIKKSNNYIQNMRRNKYLDDLNKYIQQLKYDLSGLAEKINLKYFDSIQTKVKAIEELLDDSILGCLNVQNVRTALNTPLNLLKIKVENLKNKVDLPTGGVQILAALENYNIRQNQCKKIIGFYKEYISKQIWFINSIHIELYVYKICNGFRKHLNNDRVNEFDDIRLDIVNRNLNYSKQKHFAKHRVTYLSSLFYLCLLILDGFVWGQLVLSPLISDIKIFEGFGANLLHYFASDSSNYGDLIFVFSFHVLSFILVVILSRVPALLTFYLSTYDYVLGYDKCISNQFPYKHKLKVMPCVMPKILGHENKLYRVILIYSIILIWYLILSIAPIFVIEGVGNLSNKIGFFVWNLSFWIFIHLTYFCIGEYIFVLGKSPSGELREALQDILIRNPNDYYKMTARYLEMRKPMVQEDIESMLFALGSLQDAISRYTEASQSEIIPIAKLEKQISNNKKELDKLQIIQSELEKKINPIISTMKDFDRLMDSKRIKKDQIEKIRIDDILRELKKFQ